jgi:flagellar hook-length control protein FliK
MGTVTAFDASLLLQQNPQIAATQALQAAAAAAAATATRCASPAAAGNGTAALTMAAANATAAACPSSAAGALAQNPAALAQTAGVGVLTAGEAPAELERTATDSQATGQEPMGQAARRLPRAASGGAAGGPDASTGLGAAATPAAESPTQALQHAAHARATRDALQAGADGSSNGNAGAGAAQASSAGNERALSDKLMAALEQARAPQNGRAAEPLLAPLAARQEKARDERGAFSFRAAEPTYAGSSLGVGTPDFSVPGTAAPALAPEQQVAEQVSYWISQNVQNAELTLDGLGQSPVQVSISVQGNEAQIAFRSDEAATRSLLEGAGSHLKDVLQREGLLLTGVSVGSSGSSGASGNGAAGGGERRGRQNVRQGVMAPLQVAGAATAVRARADAGRSVDLFV